MNRNFDVMGEAARIAAEAWAVTAPTRNLTDEEALLDLRERITEFQARFASNDAGYYTAAVMLRTAAFSLERADSLRRRGDGR